MSSHVCRPAAFWVLLTGGISALAVSSPLAAETPGTTSSGGLPVVLVAAAPQVVAGGSPHTDPGLEQGVLLVQHAASLGSPQQEPAGQEASVAERIARLRRAVEADQTALDDIRDELKSPESEYRQAEAMFQQLDTRLETLKKRLEQSADDETDAKTDSLKAELDKLEGEREAAKQRFDLAIGERKTIQEKAATLEKRIEQDRLALSKLTGMEEASANGAAPSDAREASPQSAAPPDASSSTDRPVQDEPDSRSAAVPSTDSAAPLELMPGAAPLGPSSAPPQSASPESAPPAPSPPAAPEPEKPLSQELQQATDDAAQKESAAKTAEEEAHSLGERMELLRRDIELERELLESSQKKADNAEQSLRRLEEEYRDKLAEGAAGTLLSDLATRVSDVTTRFNDARAEGRRRSERLDDLQSRYTALQAEQITAMLQAEQMRGEAESAKAKVADLTNPFTARNFLQWMIDYGPKILVILLVMGAVLWMSRVAERRIVDTMVKRGGLGKRAERENRARTLVSVFHNAANVAILGGGLLMILDIVGVPITALMGGAAVFGLAVAFGAQSLIKDYFYGFMILLEQQYTINDVVRIGDIAGQVERITLRMTVLRDLEGRVHFIPHGQITATTNMTHGWSRAVFDVGVAYKEDADCVIELIKQVGRELREDPVFGPLILEDLTMLGVDAFADSAVVIKFFIKTRPLKQWDVKRELLRRLKRTFDDQGIEIPFPHRTVYHRHEADEPQLKSDLHWSDRKSA